jgi:hypothetical protein
MNPKFLSCCLFVIALFLPEAGQGASGSESKSGATRVAVSQGISSPTITTPVNFSHGLLYSNPAGAADFTGGYASAEATFGNNDTGVGGEVGVGNGSAGIAGGYFKDENNKGRFGAIGGLGTASVSGGLGYHESGTYSVGMIFQPKGAHRFGLAADLHGAGGGSTSLGAGYSYHSNSFIFAIDGSRRSSNGASDTMITPGLELMADIYALSVSYDVYVNGSHRLHDDQIWFGLGIGPKKVHFAVYHDYVNDWSVALTFWI